MNKKSLFLSLGLLLGSPFLTNCQKEDKAPVISYKILCDTTDVKTNYLVGDKFDPTNLKANLVELRDGKEHTTSQLFTFTLSIDLNTPLQLSDRAIYVLPPENFKGECLPYKININVQPPVYKIGARVDFASQYPGYSFESDKPFIGRVDREGFLETYKEGEFSLTGSHVGKPPVFINCIVSEDEEIKYPAYLASDTTAGNFMLELRISPYITTNSVFHLEPAFNKDKDINVKYEITNPDIMKVEKNAQGNDVLITNTNTGSGRLRIYLNDEKYSEYGEKLLYDYYVIVVNPFTPSEIKQFLSGSHWISYALSGEKYALNFQSNSANLSGIQENSVFNPYNFSFTVEQDTVKVIDKVCAKFNCDPDATAEGSTRVKTMYVDVNFGQLFLYNQFDRLISIFNIVDEF